MSKKKRKEEEWNGWDDDEIASDGGILGWLDRNKTGILLFIFYIFLILILVALSSLRSIVKVAEVEGEIVEISDGMFKVFVTNVAFLTEGQVKNPIELTSGLCFNQLLMDKCNIGTKVRLTKYKSIFAEWWAQDSIIKSYNQTLK